MPILHRRKPKTASVAKGTSPTSAKHKPPKLVRLNVHVPWLLADLTSAATKLRGVSAVASPAFGAAGEAKDDVRAYVPVLVADDESVTVSQVLCAVVGAVLDQSSSSGAASDSAAAADEEEFNSFIRVSSCSLYAIRPINSSSSKNNSDKKESKRGGRTGLATEKVALDPADFFWLVFSKSDGDALEIVRDDDEASPAYDANTGVLQEVAQRVDNSFLLAHNMTKHVPGELIVVPSSESRTGGGIAAAATAYRLPDSAHPDVKHLVDIASRFDCPYDRYSSIMAEKSPLLALYAVLDAMAVSCPENVHCLELVALCQQQIYACLQPQTHDSHQRYIGSVVESWLIKKTKRPLKRYACLFDDRLVFFKSAAAASNASDNYAVLVYPLARYTVMSTNPNSQTEILLTSLSDDGEEEKKRASKSVNAGYRLRLDLPTASKAALWKAKISRVLGALRSDGDANPDRAALGGASASTDSLIDNDGVDDGFGEDGMASDDIDIRNMGAGLLAVPGEKEDWRRSVEMGRGSAAPRASLMRTESTLGTKPSLYKGASGAEFELSTTLVAATDSIPGSAVNTAVNFAAVPPSKDDADYRMSGFVYRLTTRLFRPVQVRIWASLSKHSLQLFEVMGSGQDFGVRGKPFAVYPMSKDIRLEPLEEHVSVVGLSSWMVDLPWGTSLRFGVSTVDDRERWMTVFGNIRDLAQRSLLHYGWLYRCERSGKRKKKWIRCYAHLYADCLVYFSSERHAMKGKSNAQGCVELFQESVAKVATVDGEAAAEEIDGVVISIISSKGCDAFEFMLESREPGEMWLRAVLSTIESGQHAPAFHVTDVKSKVLDSGSGFGGASAAAEPSFSRVHASAVFEGWLLRKIRNAAGLQSLVKYFVVLTPQTLQFYKSNRRGARRRDELALDALSYVEEHPFREGGMVLVPNFVLRPSFLASTEPSKAHEWVAAIRSVISKLSLPVARSLESQRRASPHSIKEGWLQKRGGFNKDPKVRYFILARSRLLYFRRIRVDGVPTGLIPLYADTVVSECEDDYGPYAISLESYPGARRFVLFACSSKTRKTWVDALKGVLPTLQNSAHAALADGGVFEGDERKAGSSRGSGADRGEKLRKMTTFFNVAVSITSQRIGQDVDLAVKIRRRKRDLVACLEVLRAICAKLRLETGPKARGAAIVKNLSCTCARQVFGRRATQKARAAALAESKSDEGSSSIAPMFGECRLLFMKSASLNGLFDVILRLWYASFTLSLPFDMETSSVRDLINSYLLRIMWVMTTYASTPFDTICHGLFHHKASNVSLYNVVALQSSERVIFVIRVLLSSKRWFVFKTWDELCVFRDELQAASALAARAGRTAGGVIGGGEGGGSGGLGSGAFGGAAGVPSGQTLPLMDVAVGDRKRKIFRRHGLDRPLVHGQRTAVVRFLGALSSDTALLQLRPAVEFFLADDHASTKYGLVQSQKRFNQLQLAFRAGYVAEEMLPPLPISGTCDAAERARAEIRRFLHKEWVSEPTLVVLTEAFASSTDPSKTLQLIRLENAFPARSTKAINARILPVLLESAAHAHTAPAMACLSNLIFWIINNSGADSCFMSRPNWQEWFVPLLKRFTRTHAECGELKKALMEVVQGQNRMGSRKSTTGTGMLRHRLREHWMSMYMTELTPLEAGNGTALGAGGGGNRASFAVGGGDEPPGVDIICFTSSLKFVIYLLTVVHVDNFMSATVDYNDQNNIRFVLLNTIRTIGAAFDWGDVGVAVVRIFLYSLLNMIASKRHEFRFHYVPAWRNLDSVLYALRCCLYVDTLWDPVDDGTPSGGGMGSGAKGRRKTATSSPAPRPSMMMMMRGNIDGTGMAAGDGAEVSESMKKATRRAMLRQKRLFAQQLRETGLITQSTGGTIAATKRVRPRRFLVNHRVAGAVVSLLQSLKFHDISLQGQHVQDKEERDRIETIVRNGQQQIRDWMGIAQFISILDARANGGRKKRAETSLEDELTGSNSGDMAASRLLVESFSRMDTGLDEDERTPLEMKEAKVLRIGGLLKKSRFDTVLEEAPSRNQDTAERAGSLLFTTDRDVTGGVGGTAEKEKDEKDDDDDEGGDPQDLLGESNRVAERLENALSSQDEQEMHAALKSADAFPTFRVVNAMKKVLDALMKSPAYHRAIKRNNDENPFHDVKGTVTSSPMKDAPSVNDEFMLIPRPQFSPADKKHVYKFARIRKGLIPGADPDLLEMYLPDAEFEENLGMSKANWSRLDPMERIVRKRRARIPIRSPLQMRWLKEEFDVLAGSSGAGLSEAQLSNYILDVTGCEISNSVIRAADYNGDGMFDFYEFCTLVCPLVDADVIAMRRMFRDADKDKSQALDFQEATAYCALFHVELTQELFDAADANGDGTIDYDEFTRYLRPLIEAQPGSGTRGSVDAIVLDAKAAAEEKHIMDDVNANLKARWKKRRADDAQGGDDGERQRYVGPGRGTVIASVADGVKPPHVKRLGDEDSDEEDMKIPVKIHRRL